MVQIKHVLILSELKESAYASTNIALWKQGETCWLDWQIKRIQASGRKVTVVLGSNGDETLRYARTLEDCDLVFDAVVPVSEMTSLAAGCQALNGAAFVLPINVPFPNRRWIHDFEAKFWNHPDRDQGHIFFSQSTETEPFDFDDGFQSAFLLTRRGVEFFSEKKSPGGQPPPNIRSVVLDIARTEQLQPIKTIEDFGALQTSPNLT